MIFVAQSVWRHLDPVTAMSLNAAQAQAAPSDPVCWEVQSGDALIARSRSTLATKFLEQMTESDVMVIVDDDITFKPEDLFKIAEGARETGGLYGGIYVTRARSPHPAARMFPGTEMRFEDGPVRRPVEIQYLATGFMAIPRAVLERMTDFEFTDAGGTHRLHRATIGTNGGAMWTFFDPFTVVEPDGQLHYLSEDWAFCERARQMGVTVYADESIILGHKGQVELTVADIGGTGHALTEEGAAQTRNDAVTVQTRARLVGDPLIDNLVEDIAEFSGDSVGDIRRQLSTGSQLLARLWESREESEADWYHREDVGLAYILDLANWHIRGNGAPLEYANTLIGKRVLDYGAGIGTFALAAARAGATVDIAEVNPTLREFIDFRARKYGIELGGTGTMFDVVVAWHVFEHVQNPEQVLDVLLSSLAPGGTFVSDSDFHVDAEHPMHHTHPDWDAVFRSRGLRETAVGFYQRSPVEAVA